MVRRAGSGAVAAAVMMCCGLLLSGCGGGGGAPGAKDRGDGGPAAGSKISAHAADSRTLPGVGPALAARVPAATEQAVVVYGAGPDSPDATVTLFTRSGGLWHRGPSWPAHNGARGWTTRHHEDDRKSPVGVFTLHDAGGVLPDPGTELPYHQSPSFAPPASWQPAYRHDFDYVIAIDYNRVVGTSPNDPTRPQGQARGGSIWLHVDHGSGSSACVMVSEDAMRYLLRALTPAGHPVVVMGDKAELAG
jgi:L,D-peptidoglycan transpeptidase YkuD (ErfK/YbiS/YcfS/YnhG family)